MMAIECAVLRKEYGRRAALDGLTFSAREGRILGFLGPNGAGKTTAIRIMLGLLRATSGSCRVFGRDCWREGPKVREQLGYLPGEPRFYPRLTGRSLLRFLAGARRAACEPEIRRLAEQFQLDLDRRIREHSSGMKQKLGLIQALMHRPQLLILDEPTNALDPLIRQTLFGELAAIRREGRTVLFSSHTLVEVEQLCDDVVILRDGLIMEDATVDSLKSKASRSVRVEFAVEPQNSPDAMRLQSREGDCWRFVWTADANSLLQWLAKHEVREVEIGPPRLEDLFMTYYAKGDAS